MGIMIEKQEEFVNNQRNITNQYDEQLQKCNKIIMDEIMNCAKPKI